MFSSTAYEAFYSIIGLHFHEASVNIITSQGFLTGILALIFGIAFFKITIRYFGKYFPGFISTGGNANLGAFIKLIGSFLLGVSLLKLGTQADAVNYNRVSWHNNNYIESRLPNVENSYKVSFVFDIITRSTEEVAKFANEMVDSLFKKTNSQVQAPASFYKAIMYAGSATITDQSTRSLVDLYTAECFDKVIPLISSHNYKDKISNFFGSTNSNVNRHLEDIKLTTHDGTQVTCLDLKEKVNSELSILANRINGKLSRYSETIDLQYYVNSNQIVSNLLLNHYHQKSETALFKTKKGVEVGGFWANVLISFKRLKSFDGFMSFLGLEELEGINTTANRALQFNEYLKRAPHLKGIVKLFLIGIFPWLIFVVIGGRWKVILAWSAIYFSVLLWTPIWTFMYHIMTSIALSTQTMSQFGMFNDTVSIYSAQLINSRLYQFYAIYTWLQVLVGPLPTVLLAWGMFGGLLRDSEQETAPEAIKTVTNSAGAAATGGASTVASTASKAIKK